MLGYIIKRVGLAIFTIWTITVLAWVVIEIPEGDVVDRYMDLVMQGGMGIDTEAVAADMKAYMGV